MTDSGQGEIRIGTVDREAALRELATHTNAGRLTADELAERTAHVEAARTRSELDAVFADLPEPGAPAHRQPRDAPPASPPAGEGATSTSAPGQQPAGAAYGMAVPADSGAAPQRRSPRAGQLMAVSGSLALIAFMIAGFAFDGWAWAWVFFLVPGVVRTWQVAGERGDRRG